MKLITILYVICIATNGYAEILQTHESQQEKQIAEMQKLPAAWQMVNVCRNKSLCSPEEFFAVFMQSEPKNKTKYWKLLQDSGEPYAAYLQEISDRTIELKMQEVAKANRMFAKNPEKNLAHKSNVKLEDSTVGIDRPLPLKELKGSQ